MQESEVVYDWNQQGHALSPKMRAVELHDETLRDGIQCPSAHDPDIEQKKHVVKLLADLGVHSVNVGLPGAGPRAVADVTELVEFIRDNKLPIRPGCAARTHPNDIQPIIEISQRTGVAIEVMTFLGSSPIRMYAEGWDEDRLESLTRTACKMSSEASLPVSFVTEDTVRSHPTTLKRLFEAAVEEGANRLVLCDTVGHATTNGVFNLVHWANDLLLGLGVRDRVLLDWHGHDDRGFSLPNALYAIEAGADRIHGTILGIGERVGNTPLDLLMVNLKLLGARDGDLKPLAELVDLVAEACHWEIPVSYPVFGADAFKTGTGVHAAAVIKAERRGDSWLSDRIYSGVPASWFGREQEIAIGHMSGISNVRYWLDRRGIEASDSLVQAVFERAKQTSQLLSDAQVMQVVQNHNRSS
jgi:2-isopropylmalate synthase